MRHIQIQRFVNILFFDEVRRIQSHVFVQHFEALLLGGFYAFLPFAAADVHVESSYDVDTN